MSQMVLIEEDKLKEYECLADELDFYKKAYAELNKSIDKLCDAFLGPDYYIVDPVTSIQANLIIIDEIIGRFAPKRRRNLIKNWIFNRFRQL